MSDRPAATDDWELWLRPRGDEARERFEDALHKLHKLMQSFDGVFAGEDGRILRKEIAHPR
jgi:hypothetical protein